MSYSGYGVSFQTHGSSVRSPLEAADFFILSKFFRVDSGFFEGSFWISLVMFLNFTARLLINSKNITGKNWAHWLPKNSQERF